ncbi:unnamed protein product [Gulo gulo]|uniref:Uncharacterized protein n=1 Tax=Gulo gulo TaxID=48420 RepID=A0A9X9Q5D2_GULGU|nr:unnamed protein product [Gulo gulo]
MWKNIPESLSPRDTSEEPFSEDTLHL